MIGWQNAWAFWALPLVAMPIVIHLLRTHHATRVAFPSLRFVQPSQTAAVRMRMPTDVLLMLVRMVIVALAVGALAGPIVLTAARTTAWNARTARAVVVDVSSSMRVPDGSGTAPERAASDAAAAELGTATYGHRIDARDLDDGLARASRWLATSPPARREIVLISDMQRGALTGPIPRSVGEGVGLRLVSVGRPAERKTIGGARLLGAGAVPAREQTIEMTPDTTSVAIDALPGSDDMAGLRVLAPPGGDARVARLLRAVARAGAPEGSAQQPIVIRFIGSPPETSPLAVVQRGWMLRTVLRLVNDPAFSKNGSAAPSEQPVAGDPWTVVARQPDGVTLARAAASGHALVIEIAAGPDSLQAATVVRATLIARLDDRSEHEHEIARIDDGTLAAFNRTAGPVTRDAWRTADATDARWFWLVAIVLLGVEQWLRARAAQQPRQEVARAAA